ncbi:caspase family protein [candidate division KSB1 bacterium]|nr:caspase family protein [candidate division KSB1 bacterium]
MKNTGTIISIIILGALVCYSQSTNILNTSYTASPGISYYNPAALIFINKPHASIGMQMLHTGLAGDNLKNNLLSYMHPISSKTAIGARAQYFSSAILNTGDYAIFLSQKLYQDFVSIGANVNMINYSYNLDDSFLFDAYDPVAANGTSRSAFSFGLSLYVQPVTNLFLGFSMDDLNQPDISLERTGVIKEREFYFGLSYINPIITPQIDFRRCGDDQLLQAGLRKLLADKIDLFAGYQKINENGSSAFVQLDLRIGDLGFWYAYQSYLTQDISHISNGSHQFGVFYTRSARAHIPEIHIGNIEHDPNLPMFGFEGEASCKDGIDRVEIFNNARQIKTLSGNDKKALTISESMLLQEGQNELEVVVHGKEATQREKILLTFTPLAPKVVIHSLQNDQIREDSYDLAAEITDLIGLSDLKLSVNGREEKLSQEWRDQKQVRIEKPLKLVRGQNNIKIISANEWKTTEAEFWIVYDPTAPPPQLSIDSPQQPISSSSTIQVNIELENSENVENIILKLNGQIVDTVRVQHQPLDRGLLVRASRFSEKAFFQLEQAKNLIEAIAFDKDGAPKTSKNLSIIYNPYAEEMRYTKKIGIIVGVNDYQSPTIPTLDLAVSDADTIQHILETEYKFDHIIRLTDQEASSERLRAVLSDSLRKAGPNDFILFYFAGHGGTITNIENREEGYLIPFDGDIDSDSKNISMDFMRRNALLSPARDILYIIDVCYAGLGIVDRPSLYGPILTGDIDFESMRDRAKRKSRNIIAAGGKRQTAVDGLFTRILKQGLRGEADRNADNYIEFSELAHYVKEKTESEAKMQYNRNQIPQFGSLILDQGEAVLEVRR